MPVTIRGTSNLVLQVVHASYLTGTSTSSTSYVSTGLSASITPTSATSKILVFASHGDSASQLAANGMKLRLLRNGTAISQFSNNQLYGQIAGAGFLIGATSTINYLDSPATTSSLTYTTEFTVQASPNIVTVFRDNTMGGLTLMEIAG